MIKTSTQNDIIRYIYEETSPEENQQIELSLLVDQEVIDQHNETLLAVNNLRSFYTSPSDRCVESILAYSKNVNLHSV